MKECDKRKSHIRSKLHRFDIYIFFLIMLDTLLLRLPLHFTSSHLNFNQLHFSPQTNVILNLKYAYSLYPIV